MKKLLILFAIVFSFAFISETNIQSAETKSPIKIIFDTDMGNDVDDALALAMLYNYDYCKKCELLAVTLTKSSPSAGPYIKVMNDFYGYSNIPIGITDSGVTPNDGKYVGKVVKYMGYDAQKDKTVYLESFKLMRKILAGSKEKVAIVQVGFSTSVARLLDSQADEFSPLSGKELIKEKVSALYVMGGGFGERFSKHKEYNIVTDIPSAQKVFAQCPVPIYVTGFEVGFYILFDGKNLTSDFGKDKNPLKESFRNYRGSLDKTQMTWDLTAVLYAVSPNDGFFGLSEPGTVVVNNDGTTTFNKTAKGKHYLFTVTPEQIKKVEQEFIKVCNKYPGK